MKFTKTEAWAKRNIANIERAIRGTKENMKTSDQRHEQRFIDAHQGQLAHLEKELKKAEAVLSDVQQGERK